jgi:CO/xanthine dehydrogenase Mo-binding subunit
MPDLPPGYFTVDRHDVPGRNRVKMLVDDQPFFAEETVRYTGEPILLFVGPDREVLDDLIRATRVDYEDLIPDFDVLRGAEDPDRVIADYRVTKGDPGAAFARAEEILTYTFETGIQEQLYLEPQGVVGVCQDGRVTVYASMQCPYYVKNALVQALGRPEDRVRAVQATTGGGFGGKEDYPSILACQAAVAAVKTGRPVRIVPDRDEDIRVTPKRHPSHITITAALSAAGEVLGLDIDTVLDAGAYTGLSGVVLQRALFSGTGVYDFPNVRGRGRAVLTNNVPTGCFRGFGAPQAFFAMEMFMNRLARRLGENPDLVRRRYMARQGGKTLTGGTFHDPVKLEEMLDRAMERSDFRRKWEENEECRRKRTGGTGDGAGGTAASGSKGSVGADKVRGIGLSVFLHGCGFTGSGERDYIKARVRLEKRGGLAVLRAANVEMGQGAATTLRKIVAETLDIPIEKTVYDNPDTDQVPDSGPTVASRTVMIVGGLFERAALKMKDRWGPESDFAVEEEYAHPDHVVWDGDAFQGDAYQAYSWGVNVVEVSVDTVTGEITAEQVWAVHDAGRAVDERIVRGQIEGGILQGLGFASVEVMETEGGRYRQKNLTDYCIPTSADAPPIENSLLDNPYRYGPSGAKGVGEVTLVGAAPAFALAVENALGIEINRVPVRPETIIGGGE